MGTERYIPDGRKHGPTNTELLDGVAHMLADATHAGDLNIRRFYGTVWFTLDGQVFEVKAIHRA